MLDIRAALNTFHNCDVDDISVTRDGEESDGDDAGELIDASEEFTAAVEAIVAHVERELDPTPLTVEAVTALLGEPVDGNEWRFGDSGHLFFTDGQARLTWAGYLVFSTTLGYLRTVLRLAGQPVPQPGDGT
jgi:hypothetical protein